MGQPRAGRLHDDGVADLPGRPHRRRGAGHELLARYADAVRAQELLRGVLAELAARTHQGLRLAEGGEGVRGASVNGER